MTLSTIAVVGYVRWLFAYSLSGWQGMIEQGGTVSLVLVGFAVVGLGIVIEKTIRLRRKANFNEDYEDVLLALKRGNDDQIEYELPLYPPSQVEMIETAHEFRELEKDDIYRELNSVANDYVRSLSKRLELLGSLGRLAPLVGLLGTVIGMMHSLSQYSVSGSTDPTVLGQGLSQALLTTAGGLVVGIPMIFFHNILKNRINAYAEDFEEFGHALVRAIIYPASVEFGYDESAGGDASEQSDDPLDSARGSSEGSSSGSFDEPAGGFEE